MEKCGSFIFLTVKTDHLKDHDAVCLCPILIPHVARFSKSSIMKGF